MGKRFTLLILALLALASGLAGPAAPGWASPPDDDDGRIGDRGGDYIIHCKNGFIEVWRIIVTYDDLVFGSGRPRGVLVARIPLPEVNGLHRQGDSIYDSKSGVTTSRWGDTIEVSGWGNGNDPFGRNSRVFNVSDCAGADGGFKSARAKRLAELTEQARNHLDGLNNWWLGPLAAGGFGGIDGMVEGFGSLIPQMDAVAEELEELARNETDDKVRSATADLAAQLRKSSAGLSDFVKDPVGWFREMGVELR